MYIIIIIQQKNEHTQYTENYERKKCGKMEKINIYRQKNNAYTGQHVWR